MTVYMQYIVVAANASLV